MKNQTAKFVAAESTLSLSIFRGKNAVKVSFKVRSPEEKVKSSVPEYFELVDEAKAEAAYAKLVADAGTSGWTLQTKGERGGNRLTGIPAAPKTAETKPNGGVAGSNANKIRK